MPTISCAGRLAAATILSMFVFSSAGVAQTATARGSMERCVDNVLSRMARAKAPETQVGDAVVAKCDAPLRAALASAIDTGDAFICSVESCIDMARQRAADEARSAYRERLGRRS